MLHKCLVWRASTGCKAKLLSCTDQQLGKRGIRGSGLMEDLLLDPVAQAILDGDGFDCPDSNGGLDLSLPAHLFGPFPTLEGSSDRRADQARV